MLVWYNIGWLDTRFKKLKRHEETLGKDLWEAVGTKVADMILLCECGEIGVGLPKEWLEVVRRCCMHPRSGGVWPVGASASAAKPAETSASAAKLVETSASAAKPAESQPAAAAEPLAEPLAAAAEPLADYGNSECEALTDDSEPEPDVWALLGGAEKPAEPSFPLADAMCKALGENSTPSAQVARSLGNWRKSFGRETGSTLIMEAA